MPQFVYTLADPLDTLEQWVKQSFSSISHKWASLVMTAFLHYSLWEINHFILCHVANSPLPPSKKLQYVLVSHTLSMAEIEGVCLIWIIQLPVYRHMCMHAHTCVFRHHLMKQSSTSFTEVSVAAWILNNYESTVPSSSSSSSPLLLPLFLLPFSCSSKGHSWSPSHLGTTLPLWPIQVFPLPSFPLPSPPSFPPSLSPPSLFLPYTLA